MVCCFPNIIKSKVPADRVTGDCSSHQCRAILLLFWYFKAALSIFPHMATTRSSSQNLLPYYHKLVVSWIHPREYQSKVYVPTNMLSTSCINWQWIVLFNIRLDQMEDINYVYVCTVYIFRHSKLEAALAEVNWRVRWDDIMFGAMEKKKLERSGSRMSLTRVC